MGEKKNPQTRGRALDFLDAQTALASMLQTCNVSLFYYSTSLLLYKQYRHYVSTLWEQYNNPEITAGAASKQAGSSL